MLESRWERGFEGISSLPHGHQLGPEDVRDEKEEEKTRRIKSAECFADGESSIETKCELAGRNKS